MGCDTKGIVVTECKDLKIIASALVKAIWNVKVDPENNKLLKFNNGNPTYNPLNNTLSFNFVDGKDTRNLFVCIDCDCDNLKYGELSLSLLLGAWGNSVELMQLFLTALSPLGKCYLWENDASGEPQPFNQWKI